MVDSDPETFTDSSVTTGSPFTIRRKSPRSKTIRLSNEVAEEIIKQLEVIDEFVQASTHKCKNLISPVKIFCLK